MYGFATLPAKYRRPPKDLYLGVRKQFIHYVQNIRFNYMMALMLDWSPPDIDLIAVGKSQIAWVAAWVTSRVSLQQNKRLKQALEDMTGSSSSKLQWDRLLQELPAATLIELENLQQNEESLSKLVTRTAGHLEKLGDQSTSLQRKGKLEPIGLADMTMGHPLLEEFLLKEELEAAKTSGKISKREYQVLELTSREYTEDQIARELGITLGSVKKFKHRGRKKLKAAS